MSPVSCLEYFSIEIYSVAESKQKEIYFSTLLKIIANKSYLGTSLATIFYIHDCSVLTC